MNLKTHASVTILMTVRFYLASFFLVLSCTLLSTATRAQQQHIVLFETFDNACEPCPATGLRAPFDNAIRSTVSSEGSKIIWLNHHVINICDPAAQSCPNSTFVGNRLSEWTGPANTGPLFYAAVDRAVFSSTGTRTDPNASGGSYSDWNSAIDQLASNPAGASIMLDSATLDKTSNTSYTLRAYIAITTLTSIPDSLILRCAIIQNNVSFANSGNCSSDPAPTPQNNVVRIITVKDTGMFVIVHGGASAGLTKHVIYTQRITGPGADPAWKAADMSLVAFVETGGSDYHVLNAKLLRSDLDALPAPAPTLAITSSVLDGMTFHPNDILPIAYTSSNLPNGVDAYYSLDNGTTWRLISSSNLGSPINWTVPDSLTTQGKVKLVATGDANLTSMETGTFSITPADSVAFVRPMENDTLGADTNYTIEWTKYGVDSVNLQYALSDGHGGFSNWVSISSKPLATTSYTWMIPDVNSFAELQLVPVRNEAPAAGVKVVIEKLVGGVTPNLSSYGLTVMEIYPNPAASGEDMIVRYSDNLPRPVSIQVLDLLGHVVGEFSGSHNQEIHLDTRALSSGAYIVRVSDGLSVVSKRIEILR